MCWTPAGHKKCPQQWCAPAAARAAAPPRPPRAPARTTALRPSRPPCSCVGKDGNSRGGFDGWTCTDALVTASTTETLPDLSRNSCSVPKCNSSADMQVGKVLECWLSGPIMMDVDNNPCHGLRYGWAT